MDIKIVNLEYLPEIAGNIFTIYILLSCYLDHIIQSKLIDSEQIIIVFMYIKTQYLHK